MTCPKCGERMLIKIQLKKSQALGLLCEFCEEVWFDNEPMNEKTGHSLHSVLQEQGLAYTIDFESENGPDDTPVRTDRDTVDNWQGKHVR